MQDNGSKRPHSAECTGTGAATAVEDTQNIPTLCCCFILFFCLCCRFLNLRELSINVTDGWCTAVLTFASEHISIPSSRSIRSHVVTSKKSFCEDSASVNSSRCDFIFSPYIYFSRGVKVNLTNHGCPRQAGIFAEARQRMWMTDRCFSQLLQMSDFPPKKRGRGPASKTFLPQQMTRVNTTMLHGPGRSQGVV